MLLCMFVLSSLYCEDIRVMTFNIRYNNAGDGINTWQNRKELVADMIRFHQADVVGLQEALYGQIEDLVALLPEYDWIGVGRYDGKLEGEFSAIFYLKDRFEMLNNSTFWLSETPDVPGLGWDAVCYRIVTWGEFQDKTSGKIFYHFNTHFDHKGETARKESAILLLNSVAVIAGDAAVIVTGDFNAHPDSVPYQIITQGWDGKKLIDSQFISLYPHHGPTGTFTGFDFAKLAKPLELIDYIFVNEKISVILHGTLSDTYDGKLPSDHFPVLAEIKIN